MTGSQPEVRINPARFFEAIGYDVAGPLLLKNEEKAYIALLTCAVTRAVQLKLNPEIATIDLQGTIQRHITASGFSRKFYNQTHRM